LCGGGSAGGWSARFVAASACANSLSSLRVRSTSIGLEHADISGRKQEVDHALLVSFRRKEIKIG
jgi:hypothetical protein